MKPLFNFLAVTLLSLLPAARAAAETTGEEVTVLTLEHNDGSRSHFVLADQPEVTFDGEMMVITTPALESKVERTAIQYFHFTKQITSAVESISADDRAISFVNNIFTATGTGLSALTVYDINGRAMKSAVCSGGTITADLNDLQKGIYIVAVDGMKAVKIRVN